MTDCVFCKIANKEIPAEIIWEDDYFIAVLDINPISEGMSLVLPKKHYPSKLTEIPAETLSDIVLAGQKVAEKIEKSLSCERVLTVFEGFDVNHLHMKLIPSYNESLKSILNKEPTETSSSYLNSIGDKIRGN